MARQLLENRSPAAYAGVEAYARNHAADDAGMLANLVLGYAHILDRDYAKALPALKKSQPRADELADYVAYFTAMSKGAQGDATGVISSLQDFDQKYPNSIFSRDASVIYSSALVVEQRPDEAVAVLLQHRSPPRADVELALGRAYLKAGNPEKGWESLRLVYYTMPIAAEADAAGTELQSSAAPAASIADRKTRADLLAQGKRYRDAAAEYRSLQSDATTPDLQYATQVALGSVLRHIDTQQARSYLESLNLPPGEWNAQRLYLIGDIAHNSGDDDGFLQYLGQLRQAGPTSPWLEQALLTAGNMFLLKRDYDHAIDYYRELDERFPKGKVAHYAHWKSAWLNLRQGRNDEASHAFEQQLANYPDSAEVPAALYWRARMAEEQQNAPVARAYYAKLVERFPNYYYADCSRDRLRILGDGDPTPDVTLVQIPPLRVSTNYFDSPPADDLRVEKAKLLENGGMVDFAVRELQAAASGGQTWAIGKIAEIYQDSGAYHRSLNYMKRQIPTYFAMQFDQLPRPYWEILFPRPYWTDLKRYSVQNGLDPFLVASLVRQESEFNPGAVSHANAIGLMQLLPGTGRSMARSMKIRHFRAEQLLVPQTNLQMGTRYFKDLVDKFGGRLEYALAAYNAGTDRVESWLADGHYRDPQEFVESIPFTETREYVQAILRNVTVYRKLYKTP
ncbi:MAG TPA: transglycosylase SLT domain-containing protein [Terriglobales bacterium]|nr:transglycosylase SLT domain-containing protein [Terriglobales bacterium]